MNEVSKEDVDKVLAFKPHITDIRSLPEKWVCETSNDSIWFADAPAHCPFCGKDLRYDKYHENHYREKRYYGQEE